jgi:hypothetical protein
MKIKLLFYFILVLPLVGFSQEKLIEIQAQKEFLSSVTLTPACGKGTETELPFTVFWDKKTETLKIDFKGNKDAAQMLLFFPKRMFIKEIMKLSKEVWFSKEVKKCQIKKTVSAGVDIKQLVNVEEPSLDAIQILDFADKNATINLLFKKPFQNTGDIIIPFHLYMASKEISKKERNRKIGYEAIFTLIIKKCAETTTPSQNTTTENVNCKTLYKANEQLAELLLDIKNSNPANLATLKQKYATIKKSVANSEYKKCKEEYKAFESLCGKIDNRLK